MYRCVNCGAEVEELYRRYCPSVLKLLKCVCHILYKFIFYRNQKLVSFLEIIAYENCFINK